MNKSQFDIAFAVARSTIANANLKLVGRRDHPPTIAASRCVATRVVVVRDIIHNAITNETSR